MNNSALTPSEIAQLDQLIQGITQANVDYYATIASLALIVYSTTLSIRDEIELMWMKKPSIPSVLYLLARYSTILSFTTTTILSFLPQTLAISTCNILVDLDNSLEFLGYFGVQGLLVARAYSLSQSLDYRAKLLVLALLFLTYLTGFVIPIYMAAAFPGCTISAAQETALLHRVKVAVGCMTIVTDSIVFVVTIYQVWGAWIIQRGLRQDFGQDSSSGIVSLLFKQGIWRYCFVLSVTLVDTILLSGTVSPGVSDAVDYLQQSLSVILLCEFSLQLRRSNQPKLEELDTHPTQTLGMSFRGARATLRRFHDNMTAEFGGVETDIFGDIMGENITDGPGSSGEIDVKIDRMMTRRDVEVEADDVVGATSTIRRLSTSELPWAAPEVHELASFSRS